MAAVMYARDSWLVLSSTLTLSSASPRNRALWKRDIESPLRYQVKEIEVKRREVTRMSGSVYEWQLRGRHFYSVSNDFNRK